MEVGNNRRRVPTISAFQLQSTREFGFMYDCVATQTARHREWANLWHHFGLSDTNELTPGEYFYDIDHHT
jgi:hypothetical protein